MPAVRFSMSPWDETSITTLSTSLFHHLRKILMNRKRFGSRVGSRNSLIPDDGLNGADQADFMSYSFKNGFDLYVVVVFPFVPVIPIILSFSAGISEICRGHQRQRISGIRHPYHRHLFRNFHFFFPNQSRGAFVRHICRKPVSVGHRPADTDKDRAFLNFS